MFDDDIWSFGDVEGLSVQMNKPVSTRLDFTVQRPVVTAGRQGIPVRLARSRPSRDRGPAAPGFRAANSAPKNATFASCGER